MIFRRIVAPLFCALLLFTVASSAQGPTADHLWPRLFYAGFYAGYTGGLVPYPSEGVWSGLPAEECYHAENANASAWCLSWASSGTAWTNYIMHARVQPRDGASNRVGILYRLVDPQNHYLFVLEDGQYARIYKCVDGEETLLASADYPYDQYGWYLLRMRLEDDLHIGSINGEPVVSLFDTTFMRGTGGVATYDTEARFDELWSIIDPWYVGRSHEGGVVARGLDQPGAGDPAKCWVATRPASPPNTEGMPEAWGDDDPAEISTWLPMPGHPVTVEAFPNPFRRASHLRLVLPRESPTSVVIHDLSGRRVRTLYEDALLGPGEQFLTWDGLDQEGRALAPGIYFCSVRAADERATVKLIHRR